MNRHIPLKTTADLRRALEEARLCDRRHDIVELLSHYLRATMSCSGQNHTGRVGGYRVQGELGSLLSGDGLTWRAYDRGGRFFESEYVLPPLASSAERYIRRAGICTSCRLDIYINFPALRSHISKKRMQEIKSLFCHQVTALLSDLDHGLPHFYNYLVECRTLHADIYPDEDDHKFVSACAMGLARAWSLLVRDSSQNYSTEQIRWNFQRFIPDGIWGDLERRAASFLLQADLRSLRATLGFIQETVDPNCLANIFA